MNDNNYYNSQEQLYQVYGAPELPELPEQQKNGLAIASLVLGIVSICCCAGLPLGITGLILGIISKKKYPLNNMAIVGIILSSLGIVWAISSIIFFGGWFLAELAVSG